MNAFVLILTVFYHGIDGVAVSTTTQEFSSKFKCEQAAKNIKGMDDRHTNVQSICFPK